jgi:D-glycero-alpha-D-manno-heptose 1-phosphate guanylyltransferase
LIKEAIILAGGLGTRLRGVVPDLPKCLAPVAGQPFLKFVIRYLLSQGIEQFIFSIGYKHELIEEFLTNHFPTLSVQYSIEEEPLGTGGAIKLACQKAEGRDVLIVNGDTLFQVNISELIEQHSKNNADCTLALKPMKDFDRYGVVDLNDDLSVKSFKEKQFYKEGNINGGLYVLNAPAFLKEALPEKFSFEKDWLEKKYEQRKIYGSVQDSYFIDIGIPEDYNRVQQELNPSLLDLEKIDRSWSLFIDRDGVINYEKENDYIYNSEEFKFYPGVKEAIAILSEKFQNIVVISNQRGVGKGLMTEQALLNIQQKMKQEIMNAGGRIDGIYYCTAIEPTHWFRKPNPGMALKAKQEMPSIDFSKTIMVGNKLSDMEFGRNAGVFTVYLRTTHPNQLFPHPDIDLCFDSLIDFAKAL